MLLRITNTLQQLDQEPCPCIPVLYLAYRICNWVYVIITVTADGGMQLSTPFGLNETVINTDHRPASCQEAFFTRCQITIHPPEEHSIPLNVSQATKIPLPQCSTILSGVTIL